jgi:signal transduction histidine kinase
VAHDATNSGNLTQSTAKRMPWVGFGTTLLLLILIAAAADNLTTRLASDDQWVSHSQDVERVLGRLRGDLFAGETARLAYMLTGNETSQVPYFALSERVPGDMDELQKLTADNSFQQEHLASLRGIIGQRNGVLKELAELKRSAQPSPQEQAGLTALARLSDGAMSMVQEMRNQEDNLLKQRQFISDRTYRNIRMILAASFVTVLIVLIFNFRRLWIELRERTQAEEAIRRLNGRILQVQDSERRKVARELHDSIGQVFAAMKMNLSMLTDGDATLTPERKAHFLAELNKLLDMGITEARTLSHLLHPPLLDELGFSSAANWLVEGFSQRSKINVTLDIPPTFKRMHQELELALFRVLQESLTNIHRHSGSGSANILVAQQDGTVTLVVQDYGLGIPLSILESFRTSNVGLGVGLAGMRERVNELGGRLELDSDGHGSIVRVTLPLPLDAATSHSSRNSPVQDSQPRRVSAL